MAQIFNLRLLDRITDIFRVQKSQSNVTDFLSNDIVMTYPVDKGVYRVFKNHALNSNDKSVTLPAGTDWILDTIHVDYTPDATVGTRRLSLEIQDEVGDVVFRCIIPTALTASLQTDAIFQFGLGVSGGIVSLIVTGILLRRVKENWVIRVFDSEDISAGDDMLVSILYHEITSGE